MVLPQSTLLFSQRVVLVFTCANLCTSSHASDTLQRGVIYVQPSFHFTNTLSMDLEQANQDFAVIASKGFGHIGLRVAWGSLMTEWNEATQTATWNETNCQRLGLIGELAGNHSMKLIFNTHLKEIVPRNIDGAVFKPATPDTANISGGAGDDVYHTVYDDLIVHDAFKEPILQFHTKFAQCMQPGTNVLYWKHAFESMYLFPWTSMGNNTAATQKFKIWAQHKNSDLSHWAERWNVSLASWSDLTLPNKTTATTHNTASKAYFGDFWRFWLLGVLKHGTYGVGIGDIMHALQKGANAAGGVRYSPQLGFKHWKVNNFISWTDLTQAELQDAFDLPINVTALGIYCNNDPDPSNRSKMCRPDHPSAASDLETYVTSTKAVAPAHLPILIWETGASTYRQPEHEQVLWVEIVERVAQQQGLLGYNFWQFIDWLPTQANVVKGKDEDLYHFGMHHANGSAKPVWDFYPID
eukprot:m.75669 g.75669  ORF g.75669 m.75669 type:complete len:468 (+) comp16182_c0_seq2:79-1482(+)